MRSILTGLLAVMALSSGLNAQDRDRLFPQNPVGYQFRKATLGDAVPGGGVSGAAVDEFKLSPLWDRLEKLVAERQNDQVILPQIKDRKKLLELVRTGGTFFPADKPASADAAAPAVPIAPAADPPALPSNATPGLEQPPKPEVPKTETEPPKT